MTDMSRRSIARGASWSIPAIAVASASPALAASPCANFVKGSPLPASAFAPGYYIVSNQTFGGLSNKVISAAAGIALTPAAAACVGRASISFALNTTNGGSLTLTNGKSYTLSGGTGTAGTGTAGTTNTGCSGPSGATAQACNTYISTTVANSTGTSSANPASAAINYTVTVAGYGTTAITLNVASFKQDGTNWDGVNVTVA